MNEYVAGGWGATAGILALYTWWLIHRGRVLTRAVPQSTEAPPPGAPSSEGAPAGARREVRAWP